MKMRRRVVIEIHHNRNAEELTYAGHDGSDRSAEKTALPNYTTPKI
jgi:hypothetical protein